MRVIAGTARGRILTTPNGIKTRPTGDRMKEDLFNIIAPLVPGALFLDLYCGSGAIGIEALSRKAEHATFVDSYKEAIIATKANLQNTCLSGKAEVVQMDALQAIFKLKYRKYDIIFMDPPYNSNEIVEILTQVPQLVAKNGIIVVECPLNSETEIPELSIYRQKKYKQMQFTFYTKDVAKDDSSISG